MKITFDFGNDVIVLPREAVEENLRQASREELCVLLSAACEGTMTVKDRAKALGMSERELSNAISFWRGAGAFASAKEVKAKKEEKAARVAEKKKARPSDESLPHYSADELADAVLRPEFRDLINHCQQVMGRIFNASEAEKVIGICEYLSVSPDFVALLCTHLSEDSKVSLRLLETTARSFYDRGISDFDSLNEYIELREKSRTAEGKIRTLYGIGKRAFTSAEQKYIEAWTKAGFPFEMIEYAYELTVNATGDAPMKYTNSIIEKWIANGYKTLDDARRAEEEFQKNKKPRKSRKGTKEESESALSSFATDDFFEAAMRRSYGDDGKGGEKA